MSRESLVVACLVIGVAACGDEPAAPPAPVVTSEPAPAPTPTAPPPVATPPSIPRAEVDALLASWLDAQNRGDFDAYAPLYATRFEGVRRTQRETFRLDHDAWIVDRRRLFEREMVVSTRDVEAVLTPTTAIVRFTQRWSSGSYTEEGPKRMVLVREGGALRIANEEMIAAQTVPTTSTSPVLSAFDTDAGTFIVFGEANEAPVGAPVDVPAQGMRVAFRTVSAPPAGLAAPSGTVQLVGDHGVCASTITSVGVAAIVRPHFGTEQQWMGEDFDDTTPAVLTARAEVAAQVDAMAERRYWVAVAGRSTCGPVHAAVVGDRAPVVWAVRQGPTTVDEIARLILTGATRAELITELREGMEAVGDAQPGDDAAVEAALRSAIVLHEHAQGDATSIVEVRIPIPGECGGHERVFLFTRAGDVLTRRDVDGWHAIERVIDVEGDGTPELVVTDDFGDTHRILRLGATPETLTEWRISDFDCGC